MELGPVVRPKLQPVEGGSRVILQALEEAPRIGVGDRGDVGCRETGGLEARERMKIGGRERVVGSEHHLVEPDDVGQEPQRFRRMDDAVIGHHAGIGRGRLRRDIALGGAVHALVHQVEPADEIRQRAAAMGQDEGERREAVEHAREHQRADAERGVEGILRDLRQREFRRPRRRRAHHRMDQDRHVERHRLRPERVERDLAEIDALHVGSDDGADRAAADGAGKLAGRRLGIGHRHRCDPGELGVLRAPFAERIVEHAMPGLAGLRRQAIGEDVRPGAENLVVDALSGEPGAACLDRLDELREERAHLEAVVEGERFAPPASRRAGRRCRRRAP